MDGISGVGIFILGIRMKNSEIIREFFVSENYFFNLGS